MKQPRVSGVRRSPVETRRSARRRALQATSGVGTKRENGRGEVASALGKSKAAGDGWRAAGDDTPYRGELRRRTAHEPEGEGARDLTLEHHHDD